jgi:hypothetical protein
MTHYPQIRITARTLRRHPEIIQSTERAFKRFALDQPQDTYEASGFGRYCCKSLFALLIKNSLGRRRDFRVKMWGTSSPDRKLTGDLGNAIESTEIDGRRSCRPLAGKLSPGDFRLLQQNRPVADAGVAGTSVRNLIKFRRQSQARLTAVGGATVARIRRPLRWKAAVAADRVWCL